MSNKGYVSIGAHGPDVVKVPHHVHKKSRTVSVSIIVTPDQKRFSTKFAPTELMKVMIWKKNCDGRSTKKLRNGNIGNFSIIEGKCQL